MKALDAIRTVLMFSDKGMKYLGEMSDAPLLRPGPWGGNHAMWIAGHLTVVEQDAARCERRARRLMAELAPGIHIP